jgi:1,4-dihydroxy-2-naphthoate octaprenyltransferase
MEEKPKTNPSPNFYKAMAVAFLAIGVVLIWQATVKHEWLFWALGIMTILNAIMSALKSLVPREKQN